MVKKILKFFYRKIVILLFDIIFNRRSNKTTFLGSSYGGWKFIELDTLNNSVMISCGVGEDISFDIEMINKYNLNIIFIDPTPRAIDHYKKVLLNLGKKKNINYSKGGMQNVDSYELSNIKNSQLTLIDKAIWKKSEKKKFYFPKNKNNVSLSFSNFDNNYRSDTEYIYVNTLSYNEIINDFNLKSLSLIKLDIEGSELEVIKSILNSKILPDQILVEFDELHTYRLNEIKKYYRLHTLLAEKGYISIKINEFSNQLYIKKNLL